MLSDRNKAIALTVGKVFAALGLFGLAIAGFFTDKASYDAATAVVTALSSAYLAFRWMRR